MHSLVERHAYLTCMRSWPISDTPKACALVCNAHANVGSERSMGLDFKMTIRKGHNVKCTDGTRERKAEEEGHFFSAPPTSLLNVTLKTLIYEACFCEY